ncbi:MAG: YibE/F family protein [Arachnia sp.]
MGHGHSHGPAPEVEVSTTARTALIVFLAATGIAALIGMLLLWPSRADLDAAANPIYDAPGVTYEDAVLQEIDEGCAEVDPSIACYTATVEVTTGEGAGDVAEVQLQAAQAQSGLQVGDVIEVARVPSGDQVFYSYTGTNRLPVLAVLMVLFVIAVVAVARWKGLFAMVGLAVAAFVLAGFMLPALIVGAPGMAVALAGSTAIMFVVLYVAHGISIRTSTALAGTLLGLVFTTALGSAAVYAARLSGFAEETEYDLAQVVPGLDFQELLISGIIIGGLGVLNDVTITQSSAVWELRAAAPNLSRMEIFAAGMRIGRDHIASTIYTIVFAYAGGALTILLLLYFSNRGGLDLFGVEMFASEAVRTLASAIGLVLSVPITTGIAAITVGGATEPEPASAAA